MSDAVTVHVDGEVAVVVIDHPPVNALDVSVVSALAGAIEQVQRRPDVRAVVVMCAGRTFIAGADIAELERAAWDEHAPVPDLHDLMTTIEDCAKPVVMALHGTALGGGAEVAMAGHYRVAMADAQIGFPEVNLGIIPGAEGTQRLPRLVGVRGAIEMIVSGKPISATEALRLGLIDRIVGGDLRTDSVAFAREIADRPITRTRDRRDKLESADAVPPIIAEARASARATRRNQRAPLAAIDAIEAAALLPFDQGRMRERELAIQCVRSEECRAMVHAFRAERAVSRGAARDRSAAAIERVAIIGAGTMGSGIATACANAGLEVTLSDATQDALGRGLSAIRKNYESSVRRGRLSSEAAEERVRRIAGRVGYDGVETADLIIEAVFENLALKREVFEQLDRRAKSTAILATNTSTLNIDAIASATRRPTSVVGLHFFSPAHVMRLLEIVRGSATSPDTVAAASAFAKRLGKIGVVVGNGPGFVGNRMMFPYMYEAQFLVEDGATPAQVDRALTDWGMAMGIFAVDDLGGLDVAWRVRQELKQFDDPGSRKPLVADRLCEMGRFGQKTGRGWYKYDDGRTPNPDPEVIALIESVAREAGIRRRTFTDLEIVERTIYALINEGARVVEEGLVARSADIDVIYLNGYGFPRYRGGPMFYADSVGLSVVHDRVARFHQELGPRWKPAPLLEKLAREGATFRQLDAARDVHVEPSAHA